MTTQIINIIKNNQTDLTDCKRSYASLETKYNENNERSERQIAEYRKEINDAGERLTQLNAIFVYLKSKNYFGNNIIDYIKDLESTIDKLKIQIPLVRMETDFTDNLEKQNKELTSSLKTLQESNNFYSSEINRIKNILSQNNINTDNPISTLISEYNTLKENLKHVPNVEKMKSQFEYEVEQNAKAIENLQFQSEQKYNQLQSVVETLQRETSISNQKIIDLNNETSRLRNTVVELTDRNQTLSSQNQTLSSQNQTLSSQNQTLSSQNQTLSSQIENLHSEISIEKTRQRTAYVSPTQSQESATTELDERTQQINDRVNDLQNRLNERDKTIEQLKLLLQEDKQQKLKSSRSRKSAIYNKPSSTLTDDKNEIIVYSKNMVSGQEERYIEEINRLKSLLSNQTSSYELMQSDIQNIKNSLETAINTSAIGPDFVALNKNIDEQTEPYAELEQKYYK
ncbi:AciNPV44 [Apocheima cinerarium nucleopolyhedrovirus]|uniref:AciNPV44 n=1 Tax=Apocheima cinerarium nucleopolyhedrovirus TaxID=307461 RepID=UPI0001D92083|nr:AciNPV44 [Apocheima cinerarium nucleopolyhedrovirus]ADB84405.1 AciNPV44 [Apocheima cinerarium nucleopolyhedrovirus]